MLNSWKMRPNQQVLQIQDIDHFLNPGGYFIRCPEQQVALVKKINAAPTETRDSQPPAEPPADVHTRQAEEKLRFALGTRVKIRRQGKKGKIEIDFTSEDELQRLYDQLMTN